MRVFGTVMRIRVMRVAICSAWLFGLLVMLAFIRDSLFLFHPARSQSRKASSDSLETDCLGDSDCHNNIRYLPLPKEIDDKGDHLPLPKDNQDSKAKSAERQPVDHLTMPHEHVKADAVGEPGQQSADNGSSQFRVYEWERDFEARYFRDNTLSDDMLAVKPLTYLTNYKNPCFYVADPGSDIIVQKDVVVRLRCLPYFHLIGVDKSGTTDLWFRLVKHRHVVPNSGILGKETHWWSWRRFGFDIWVKNAPVRHFDWYISFFDKAAKVIADTTQVQGNVTLHPVITGEGSPTVFWDFTGWDRMPQNEGVTADNAVLTPHCIHHFTPHAKLILMLRNPVDRLYSEYLFLDRFKAWHNVSAGLFHQGVQRSIAMYHDCVRQHKSAATCLYDKTLHMNLPVRIMVGMYAVWLKQWLKVFPKKQLLVLRNEDYAEDMATHLAKVFSFLELDPLSEAEMKNVVKQKRAFERSQSEKAVGDMLPATRRVLTDFYRQYNKELAHIMDDNRYLWQ